MTPGCSTLEVHLAHKEERHMRACYSTVSTTNNYFVRRIETGAKPLFLLFKS